MGKFTFNSSIGMDMKAASADSFVDNIQMIEFSEIKQNKDNFYTLSELELLADDIERQGLKHNLVVCKDSAGSGYWLISGHRRYSAIKLLIEQNRLKSTLVPCYVDGERTQAEAMLKQNPVNKFLRMMVISDLHSWSRQELEMIRDYDYHCCVLLGDIPLQALEFIRDVSHEQIFGVLGNHDDPDQLKRCGIPDLNGKVITVNGVTIAGLSGSHRYKDGNHVMLSQKESISAAKQLPPADILISHDTVYHIMGRKDNAHCGLKGISQYISNHKTKLNLCGHYHENSSKSYKGCEIRCIYGCSLIDFCSRMHKCERVSREVRQIF